MNALYVSTECYINQSVHFQILIYVMSMVYAKASNSANMIVSTIDQLLINSTFMDKATIKELERFSTRAAHRNFRFTAFGFFELNLGVFSSMLAAVTSYTIVLLQFEGLKT